MAVTVDKVIVELEAKMAKYNADVKSAEKAFAGSTKAMEAKIVSLERQIKASSGSISTSIKGVSGALAGMVSAREIGALIDSFTRLQNQLKVAGFEGQQLLDVQKDLSEIAMRYGTQLEATATLFGRNTSAAKELGLTYDQQLRIVETTSAALKVNGTTAEQAAGALLQLSQVLGGSNVQAEEYNSLIDSMRPLLQGVANGSDRWKGSVAALTRDVKASKVSVDEFVQALLKGSGGVIEKAATSTLTLSGAFENLRTQLVLYVGAADQGAGASAALKDAINLLADNLDTVANTIAVIATITGGRLVASLVASTGAAAATSTAMFALQARMAGAATTAEALSVASAAAGRSLLSLFGGPVGLGITVVAALAAGLHYYNASAKQTAAANSELAKTTKVVSDYQADLQSILAKDPSAQTAKNTNALAAAHRNAANAAYQHAAAEIAAQRAQGQRALDLARRGVRLENRGRAGTQEVALDTHVTRAGSEQSRAVRVAELQIEAADKQKAALDQAHKQALADPPVIGPRTAPATSGGKTTGTTRAKGPSAQDIQSRFEAEMQGLNAEIMADRIQLAESADEEANLSEKAVEATRAANEKKILADGDYTAAQKALLVEANNNVAFWKRSGIEHQRQQRAREDQRQAEEEIFDRTRDDLDHRLAMADSERERRRIQLELIDLEYARKEAVLKEIEATGDAAAAARARAALAALPGQKANAQDEARQGTMGPMQKWMDEANQSADALNESFEQIAVDGLDELNKGLVDAIFNSGNFAQAFGNMAKSILADLASMIVKQMIYNSLVKTLSGTGIGNFLGISGPTIGGQTGAQFAAGLKIPALAGGGPVTGGKPYVVGEEGAELFVPQSNGRIIPNGRLAANSNPSPTAQIGVFTNEYLDAKILKMSEGVSVAVTRAAAPTLINGAVAETTRQMSRAKM